MCTGFYARSWTKKFADDIHSANSDSMQATMKPLQLIIKKATLQCYSNTVNDQLNPGLICNFIFCSGGLFEIGGLSETGV